MVMEMILAVNVLCKDKPGVLRDIAALVASFEGNIRYTQEFILTKGRHAGLAAIYMEIENLADTHELSEKLKALDAVENVAFHEPFEKIWGSRIIIIGGGAQVAQVALGAITEADRHNIRGERISIDTLPIVDEHNIAEAVNAVSRTHRASILVLAGSLMGGKIAEEVKKLQSEGFKVIALNMAGSVPEVADLVVTDPIQAGTFAVMAIAKTASFDLDRVSGRRF
jgi:energy-converting hydrogenase B subunit Q